MNLSSKVLLADIIKNLNYSLRFFPTPAYNPFNTHVDVFKLIKSIKLKRFFGETVTPGEQFKQCSTFVLNIQDASTSVFEKLVLQDLRDMESVKFKIKNNLCKEQIAAIHMLAKNPSLTIKPADKDGGIVILDTVTYDAEAYCQLNYTTFNQKIDGDLVLIFNA